MDYNFDYGESSIQISKNSFLKDVELLIESNNDTIKIINPYVPLFKNIRISLLNKNQKKGNYLVNKNFDDPEEIKALIDGVKSPSTKMQLIFPSYRMLKT